MKTPLLLREALPYLQMYRGKTFVLKTGGQVISHEDFERLIQDMAVLVHLGIKIVCVFGAGPQLDETFSAAGIESRKIDGLRLTTPQMITIMQTILQEQEKRLNKLFDREKITVQHIEKFITAENIPFEGIEEKHNTGRVTDIDVDAINQKLSEENLCICQPLIGNLNCNADDISLALAAKLKAEKLIYLTGTKGILIPGESGKLELLHRATPEEIEVMIADGTISAGMVPKARTAIDALQHGIKHVQIISGLHDGTLLREIFSDEGVGTMIANTV